METLYILLIAIGVVGAAFGLRYLIAKLNIKPEEIIEGVDVLKSAITFIKLILKDMGLPQDEIDKYSIIAVDTLSYIDSLYGDASKDEKVDIGVQYAVDIAGTVGLEINEEREEIIATIILLGLNIMYAIDNNKIKLIVKGNSLEVIG